MLKLLQLSLNCKGLNVLWVKSLGTPMCEGVLSKWNYSDHQFVVLLIWVNRYFWGQPITADQHIPSHSTVQQNW